VCIGSAAALMSEQPWFGVGRWRKYSAEDGGFYFHNEETGQSVWDPPPGWSDPPESYNAGRKSRTSAAPPPAAAASMGMASSDVALQSQATNQTPLLEPQGGSSSPHHDIDSSETSMSPEEQRGLRQQVGSGAATNYEQPASPQRSDREPAARTQPREAEPAGPGCCEKCSEKCPGKTIGIIILIILLLAIIIVLPVVLTLDHAVSCHSGDEGYFVKLVPPPTLTSVSPYLICNYNEGVNISVQGTAFLWYNNDVPHLKIGGKYSLPAFDLQGCEEVSGVKGQTVRLCTSFQVVVPEDKAMTMDSVNDITVENPSPDAHPAARQTSPCEVTWKNYGLLLPAPAITSVTPPAVCDSALINVTVTGSNFLFYLRPNASDWTAPTIMGNNGFRVSQSLIVPDNCNMTNVTEFEDARCAVLCISLLTHWT